MFVVFEQVFVLFAFVLAGYILSRCRAVNSEHSRLLSALLVYVFFPCKIFKTFAANLTVPILREKSSFILVSVSVLATIILFATIMSKLLTKAEYERRVLKYSMIIANAGYMGYTLVEALFGEAAVFNMMIFGLPVSLYTYTGGYCLLLRKKLSFKQLVNPVTIAILCGSVCGLIGFKFPAAVSDILQSGSACTGPVSMLMTGIVISEFKIRELLKNRNIYIVSFIRLLFIPIALILTLGRFCSSEILMSAVFFYCMPCGLNSVVFPKLIGEDCRTGAGLALTSTVLSCITVPLCTYLLSL